MRWLVTGPVVCLGGILAVAGAAADTAADAPDAAADAADELVPRPNIARVEHQPAGTAPTAGPSTALVTIDYFFIPGAEYTSRTFPRLAQLQAAHPSRIRIIYRIVRRGRELLVPIAAAEAHAQGRFFEFMALVVRHRTGLRREQILEVARQAGLDPSRLEAAWEDGRRHEPTLNANEARRQRLHAKNLPDATFNGVAPPRPLHSLESSQLEAIYLDAYDRALDALDRGVPRPHLAEVFDREAYVRRPDQVFAPGPLDDPDPGEPLDGSPALLGSPLDTRAWPALGTAVAPVQIVVLCNLRTVACRNQIVIAQRIHDLFDGQVRVSWAPMFDPGADDAAATTIINDAALCAEELGTGWAWIEQAINVAYRRHGRSGDADNEIDLVIAATELDGGAVARCLASGAGASARLVSRLRKAGVRTGPSLVVGGRVYPGGLADFRMLQALVEDELAPGVLEALVPSWSRPAPR